MQTIAIAKLKILLGELAGESQRNGQTEAQFLATLQAMRASLDRTIERMHPGPPVTREQALIGTLAYVIYENRLREGHGEDTIGVLMKCGAFRAVDEPLEDAFVAELAKAIDNYERR